MTTPMTPDEQVAAATAAEVETLSTACRIDPARLDPFLADDFHEIGASGAQIVKAGTADRVAAYTNPDDPDLVPEDLTGRVLADGLVLLTYRLATPGRTTLRCSLWRRADDGRWQMTYHQGTVVPEDRLT